MVARKSTEQSVCDNEYLVKALAMIVEKLQRKMNLNVEPPVPMRGVLEVAVKDVFFGVMATKKHPLALTVNAECTDENPCNSCREDVFRGVVNEAKGQGLLGVGYQGKDRKTVIYYAPFEMVECRRPANKAVMDEVLATL